jgi:hypothetical protein
MIPFRRVFESPTLFMQIAVAVAFSFVVSLRLSHRVRQWCCRCLFEPISSYAKARLLFDHQYSYREWNIVGQSVRIAASQRFPAE